jgi:tetratricopeptide (TPR) repeat protein
VTRHPSLPPLLVFLITLALYLPHLDHPFLYWDDDKNLLQNIHYRDFGRAHLRWMFTNFHLGVYQPLSWLSWAVDYKIWGLIPFGYHLTNLLLHASNAVLLYFLSIRLFRLTSFPTPHSPLPIGLASFFTALAFSIHPLRVSSVVWASNRSYPLAGFFFLATILAYLRAVDNQGKRYAAWLTFSLPLFACSLLSKAIGMSLPGALLLLDLYPLRRLPWAPRLWFIPGNRKIWTEKIPFMLLTVSAATVALWAKTDKPEGISGPPYGILPRLAKAGYGALFYPCKTLLPWGLHPLYEKPFLETPMAFPFWMCEAGAVTATLGLFLMRRRLPSLWIAWCAYLFLATPFLGLIHYEFHIAADRYSYLPGLPWSLIAGGCLAGTLQGGRTISQSKLRLALPLLIITLWSILAWQQNLKWQNTHLIWKQTLLWNPTSEIAHNNRAIALHEDGAFLQAIAHLTHAIRTEPHYILAIYNRGNVYGDIGWYTQAVADYTEGLKKAPRYLPLYINRGALYMNQLKDYERAEADFRAILTVDPKNPVAHYNLGLCKAKTGKLEEALAHLSAAIQAHPGYAKAYRERAFIHEALSNPSQAEKDRRKAYELAPDQMTSLVREIDRLKKKPSE